MATLEEFERRMARLATKVAENADRIVRKVALATDQVVVMATPVDTGRARANWVTALDSAPTGVQPEPSSPGGGASQALSQARATVADYNGDDHTSIHITNNLPYIGKLDQGSSRQAPAGFVVAAVLTASRAVKGVTVLGG